MSDHSSFVATATKLIAKHGRSISLVTVSDDSGNDWAPTQSDSSQSVIGVNTRFSYFQIQNGLIKQGDKMFLIDSVVAPATGMRLTDGSDSYQIVDVDRVQVGDQIIMYKVHARG